jgi:hypothetical protein
VPPNDLRLYSTKRAADGQLIFNTYTGVLFENVPIVRSSPLMSQSVGILMCFGLG